MQKTVAPSPHHFGRSIKQSSSVGKLSPAPRFTLQKPPPKSSNMAQLRTARATKPPVQSFVGGGAFGASKFFMKKQNRAATKIQALIRAFLVQARLYRKRVLEPRMQELKDVEARKTEELRRIEEQKQEERKGLAASIQKEMEAEKMEADELRKEIEEYTKVNEELSKERKEVKRKNKELQATSNELKDKDFKVSVANNKIKKENAELQATLDKYQYAVEDGLQQKKEMEASVSKNIHQQNVMRRYINKIIKLADEKAHASRSVSPPSPNKERRKSDSPKRKENRRSSAMGMIESGERRKSDSPKRKENRRSSTMGMIESGERRKSDSPKRKENRRSSTMGMIESSKKEPTPPTSPNKPKRRTSDGKKSSSSGHHSSSSSRQNKKGLGNPTYDWATQSFSALDAFDILDESLTEHLVAQPDDQACFDWATKSYNWTNQAIDLSDESEHKEAAPAKASRRESKSSSSNFGMSKSEHHGQQRRHSDHKKKGHHGNKQRMDPSMKELLQELRTIKRRGIKH